MTAEDERAARRARRRRRLRRRRQGAAALLVLLLAASAAAVLAGRGGSERGTDELAGGPAGASEAAADDAPARASEAATTAPATGATSGGAREAAPARGRRVKVAAVGDTVMGSLPYGLPPDGGARFFSQVDHLLEGDVVLGNLEGVLATGGTSKCAGSSSPNCFAFRSPPSYAVRLKEAGFTVMSLANNHSHDFGPVGLRQTVAALSRVGIRSTGRPGTVAIQRVGGTRVAVLGFAPYPWADSLLDIPRAKRRVRAVSRRADIVIVTFHGGAEGADRQRVPRGPERFLGEPRGDTRAFSRAVVDAGADLVVGHGPHVLRGMEVYRGRLIAYSLGNFAGWKVFSLGGPLSTSAVLQVTLRPDGRLLGGRIRPTRLVGAGVPAPGGDGVAAIRRLSRLDFGATAPLITPAGTIRPPRSR